MKPIKGIYEKEKEQSKADNKKIESETENKLKWFGRSDVIVQKLSLLKTGKNGEYLKAVKFYTDKGVIIYYPKEKTTNLSVLGGFDTEQEENKYYLVSDFILNNTMLVELNKNLKKEPQEVILTYCESVFNDEIYLKMFKNQFEHIYYEKFHKDNKENLEYMELAQQKYAETDLE